MTIKLLKLLKSELELIKLIIPNASLQGGTKTASGLKWLAKQADIVELIYALYHRRCFGDVKLKDVVVTFEQTFGIKIHNFSHTFGRIRFRKGERCTFITNIWTKLNHVMGEMD